MAPHLDQKNNSSCGPVAEEGELFKTHIGGSALIEGVMMRGKHNWGIAVRMPNGEIHTEAYELEATPKDSLKKKPFVRGWFALVDSMKLNSKALNISAEYAYLDEEDPAETDGSGISSTVLSVIGTIVGIIIALAVFNVFPSWLANITVGDYSVSPFWWNTVQNILQLILFALYVVLIARMKDVQRMFGYHGAEHKTIHCFEHGEELTVENCQRYSTKHVRCGTAFIVMTTIISIILFTVLPLDKVLDATGLTDSTLRLAVIILMRLALIPLVTAVTYEFTVTWAGKNPENPLVKAMLWPGILMQRLTTKEPDDGMVECAIEAVKLVIAREEKEKEISTSNIVEVQFETPQDEGIPANSASVDTSVQQEQMY